MTAEVFYKAIDATEIKDDGSLRLYRRRGLFGVLRRRDVFHPAGEWWSVQLHKDGRCYVRLSESPVSGDGEGRG